MTLMEGHAQARYAPAIGLLIGLLTLSSAPPALAGVSLTHSVQKREAFVDEAGIAQHRLVNVDGVVAGDELRYTIRFVNDGPDGVEAGSIVITNPLPADTEYLAGSASGAGTQIDFSTDAGTSFGLPAALTVRRDGKAVAAAARDYTTIRWKFAPALEPGAASEVSFEVRIK